ncbi:hypothetical protein LINGRAHAP2_LOCUS30662 [Linum grandiflorum]
MKNEEGRGMGMGFSRKRGLEAKADTWLGFNVKGRKVELYKRELRSRQRILVQVNHLGTSNDHEPP